MSRLIFGFLLVLLSNGAWAELEVITLQHRSAEEILPVVRPLLDANGVANGMNNQLILRTSPHNIAEIKQLLDRIDTPLRRLRITVLQNVDRETARRLTEISGSIGIGNSRVTVPGSRGNGGLTVEAGQGGDRLRARINSTETTSQDYKRQQVMVLEGSRALIRTGQSVPVRQHQVVQSPWETRVIDSTEYREVNNGFYVLPRISGDRVTLEISAQNDAVLSEGGRGAAQVQNVTTTVSGYLGQWLVLGKLDQQGNDGSSTLSRHTTSHSEEQRNILLKVEEAP